MRKLFFKIIFLFLLLFGEKAHSQIVYTDIEPDTTMDYGPLWTSNVYYSFDVNNDMVNDFSIQYYLSYGERSTLANPLENFEFVRILSKSGLDTLQLNDSINENCIWVSTQIYISDYFGITPTTYSIWNNTFKKFAGFRLKSGIDYYYGWIRFRDCNTISDFAINMTPNEMILAGQGLPHAAERVKCYDIDNNQNGLDLRVTAEKSMCDSFLSAYRILVVKSEIADTFDLIDANNVPSANYLEVPSNGNDIDAVFGELSTSTDGELISEFIDYKIFILSVADGVVLFENALSVPSDNIYLSSPCGTASNITVDWIYSGDTRYDISYSFEKAIDETGIVEYRMFFVKTDSMDMFTLDYATLLTEGSYISFTPTGENVSGVFNSDILNDFTSNLISHNTNYRLIVMSVANGAENNVNSFSEYSGILNLTSPLLPVKGPLAIDNSDFGNGKDIKISFFKLDDESGLSEYRIIAVKKDSATTFNLEKANLVNNEIYSKVLPTGTNYELVLHDNLKDTDGDYIVSGQPYRFFVLSVADMILKDINALSVGSNILTIEEPNRIYAGQTTGDGIFYTDIDPDTIMDPFLLTDAYKLDLDNNGVKDFVIWGHYMSLAGGYTSDSGIDSYGSNEITYIPGTNCPDTLKSRYMINEDLIWSAGGLNFGSSYSSPPPGDDVITGIWNPLSDYYTGLKLVTPGGTYYGWVSFGYVSSWQVTIKGYAYQVISNSISEIPDNQNLRVYPNPISTMLQAQLLINEPISDDKITIRNLEGITIKYQTINDSRLLMNVEDISPGIYFLEWNHNGVVYRKKFVVCR